MRRRLALSLTTFVLLAAGGIGTTARPVGAQGVLDAIKKKADEAKKAADAVKRKADSTSLAAAKAKASADSAKIAAENAKTSVEGAAKAVTSSGNATAIQAGAPTRNGGPPAGATPTPRNARGNAPVATPSAPSTGPRAISRSAAHVEEQVVLAAEAGTSFNISPRGQHVAARMLKGSRTVMVLDGVAGPPFEEIPGIAGEANSGGIFSDDGAHHAYVARQGTQWVVMEDGKEVGRGSPFFQISGNATMASIGFTPGSKHLYFTTADVDHNKFQFYLDGKPDPVIQDWVRPVISPDGEHYAYEFQVNKETGNPLPALMVDGKRAPYVGTQPQFTADGLHLYTTVSVPRTSAMDVLMDGKPIMRVGGVVLHLAPAGSAMFASVLNVSPTGARSVFLTIGNKRVPNSDCHGSAGIDAVFFSADVKHWAARCQDSNTSYWVMADGKKGQEYQGIISEVSFTADGRPVYVAIANSKQFVIVGDQEYGPYAAVQLQAPPGRNNLGGVPQVALVTAGNHVGFIGMEQNNSGLNRLVVVDGKAIKGVGANNFAFSADGSRFAYLDGYPTPNVVLDGVQRIAAPHLHDTGDVPAQFVFSPDGKHIAFASASQSPPSHAVAVDDGTFSTDAGSHYDITFTPDGRHLVWMGQRSDGPGKRVYMDGEPVLEFDQPASGQQSAEVWWSMGSDGVLSLLAQDGGVLKRFRVTPGNGSIDARVRR
jgi:hypothetical protein